MKGIFIGLLWLGFSLAAWADGMVIPTVAYPAHVTIPDQRALIHFTNGTERLVIETRFTGAGTNFAWVVPFPNEPVIEAASTGLFPTLEYLFRPKIIHQVPRYYTAILALMGIGYLLFFVRPTGRLRWADVLACICVGLAAGFVADRHEEVFSVAVFCLVFSLLFCDVILVRIASWSAFTVSCVTVAGFFVITTLLLPTLGYATRGIASAKSNGSVSILDRQLVGIFETTTLSSRDPAALENWLRENGFALPTNAAPVIAGYVKAGWVFVASKIRRDRPDLETSTPHPLSFTFQTVKPVYPMQLTGLNNPSLTVALYVFANAGASAPHFKVESCQHIINALLRPWVGDSTRASKLTATLSPDNMRQDVWLDLSPTFTEKKNRLYSATGALTTALNWGAGFFVTGLCLIGLWGFNSGASHTKFLRRAGIITLLSLLLTGLIYLSLPTIEVKLVKGGRISASSNVQQELLMLGQALNERPWQTIAEARAIMQATMAAAYGYGWGNEFVGGPFREEDSPGNYLLRETNRQLELGYYEADGEARIMMKWDLPASPVYPETHLK